MELHVSSKEAAESLDNLLDRVSANGDTVVIERDGRPSARLVPAEAPSPVRGRNTSEIDLDRLAKLIEAGRQLNDGWAEAVEEAVRLGNQPMPLESPWDR